MNNVFYAFIFALFMSGCGSNTAQTDFAKQQEKIETIKADIAKQTQSDMPDWFLNYEPEDATGVYSVGSSFANDPQVALDDARTLALTDIARVSSSKLSAQKSQIQKKSSDGKSNNTSELIIDEFINGQNVAGYKVVKREVKREGAIFRAYIMLFFPNEKLQTDSVTELRSVHKSLLDRVAAESKNAN